MSSTYLSQRGGSIVRRSIENIEIVPQEAVIQHKGPETMIQEKVVMTTSDGMRRATGPEVVEPPSTSTGSTSAKNRLQVIIRTS